MTKRSRPYLTELRKKAEETLDKQPPSYPREHDPQKLAHELSVHEIELEMQNEELRNSQRELEAAREKYFDLYDLAPVAYLTINEKGLVAEANLTTFSLLGVDRLHLVKQSLTAFIDASSQDTFYRHRHEVLMTGRKRTCELVLKRKDGTLFPAELQSVALLAGERPSMTPRRSGPISTGRRPTVDKP
jgi:PAS domain S-box-containing protein